VDISSKESYLKLLDNLYSRLGSRAAKSGDRTIELAPTILHEQKQTVITNFRQLAEMLNREPEHIARFIFKETGRPGTIERDRLVISGKMTDAEIVKLLQLYFREFVRCPVCGGVDTQIVSEKKFRFLVCEVCGAKSSIRKI
jgi:translation initiation factor 2 subunit 2